MDNDSSLKAKTKANTQKAKGSKNIFRIAQDQGLVSLGKTSKTKGKGGHDHQTEE
jgi:hypothetical protein